ncbi:hypothetical protein ACET3Z_015171 [Daucus carota]
MGFLTLLEVASMPIMQVLIISILGALMATEYLNLLPADTRKTLNKIVFVVFTPSLVFTSLDEGVTLQDIISWWYMPVNIGLTFLIGGVLGWFAVRLLKPEPHLEGLVIAMCSTGNLGNLVIIIVPAICTEEGNPFGDHKVCSSKGLSYSSFSMALGGFFIWTYTYQLIRSSSIRLNALKAYEEDAKSPNKDLEANEKSKLLNGQVQESAIMSPRSDSTQNKKQESLCNKFTGFIYQIVEEMMAPPTIGTILGFLFGTIPWLKYLVIGDEAPLRVIQDTVRVLGTATIPCITLILGGNLAQGLRDANIRPMIIVAILCVRYVILPVIGIGVVKAASSFGWLPSDPLFQFVLLLQFCLPPAMNIGTMTQLFDVGQAECSIIFLWTYLVAAFALTICPVPTHQHIAHLILEQKSPSQAIQTFKWASKLPHFTHTQSTYRALVHKLCSFRCFDIAREVLDEMPVSIGETPDEDVFVTIIRGFGRARMIRDVIEVVDLVSKFGKTPSLKVLNSILDVLVKEDIDIARKFYRKKMVDSDVIGDEYTFGIMMKGLCMTNRIAEGFKVLQMIKNLGVIPNAVIYNTLIHALCRNGKVGRARSLMSEMREPSQVTFNIMISAYCGEDNLVQALVMLEKCFNLGLVPDVITLTKVVEILCSSGRALEAVEVVETVERKGGIVDVVAYNTLIRGFCNSGKVKVGQRFLKEMERKGCLPNADTYNILISGFCESGMLDSAYDMFNEMKIVGIIWNFITYDTLIHGFCSRGRMKDGLKILELMEESIEGSRGHISPYNSVIYGLYKENFTEEALEFLAKMERLFPRVVDKSLKIIGLCKDDNIEDANGVYDQMTKEGGVPSALVYVHLIHGYCKIGRTREAFELMNEMVGHGYLPTASTLNVLILELCKQGRVGSASKFLEDMIERGCLPDHGSYGPVVDGFCGKGDLQKALPLFFQMVETGIIPEFSLWNSLVVCISQKNVWLANKNICYMGETF